jgi:hypothetical protein
MQRMATAGHAGSSSLALDGRRIAGSPRASAAIAFALASGLLLALLPGMARVTAPADGQPAPVAAPAPAIDH